MAGEPLVCLHSPQHMTRTACLAAENDRLRRAIARVLAVIRRKAGGAMAEIRSVLEEAMRGP